MAKCKSLKLLNRILKKCLISQRLKPVFEDRQSMANAYVQVERPTGSLPVLHLCLSADKQPDHVTSGRHVKITLISSILTRIQAEIGGSPLA